MSKSTQRISYFVFAALAGAAIIWGLLPTPLRVDTARIIRGPLQVTVEDDGKTRIREKYIVSAPLAGRLVRINLHAGDLVKSGETLLARIEPTVPTLLDARDRLTGEARVRAAEASVQQAEATLNRAEASLEFAETELGRAQALLSNRTISAQEALEKQLIYRTAQADLKAARFGQEIAVFELQQARAALLRFDPNTACGQSPHFLIPSPIDGSVLRVLQESETVVQPGTPLLEIGDPANLEVVVDVLSSDAVRIRAGAKVSLEHWGGPRPLAAIVRVIEPSAFTKVSALGVEEQRTNVIIDFVDPPEARSTLGDGFRVDARIVVEETPSAIKAPTGAVFRVGKQWAVFVLHKSHARLQPVEIGHRNDVEAVILSGLVSGDIVIVHPSDQVSDGTRVEAR